MKRNEEASIEDKCLAVADEFRRWDEVEKKHGPREVETKVCWRCVAYSDEVDVCSIEEREMTEDEYLGSRAPDWCPLRPENGGPVILKLADGI